MAKPLLLILLSTLLISASPAPNRDMRLNVDRAALSIDAEAARPAVQAQADRRPLSVRNLRITRELPIVEWLRPGEYSWDAEAAAAARGETIIVVNIRSRVLSAYRDGVEIGRSSILYGWEEHPTPLGTFPILEKRRDHRSNLYDAPMPHMQRLTWDGVALHGSPRLADDVATHGCIGLPREFAALLFEATRVGDRVIVWSGRPEDA